MRGRYWTGKEEVDLRRMWDNGLPVNKICEVLSRSEDSIRRRASFLGLKARKNNNRVSTLVDYETMSALRAIAAARKIQVGDLLSSWIADELQRRRK